MIEAYPTVPIQQWRRLASAKSIAHTGDTTETTLATVTLPGGALGANGILRLTLIPKFTGTAGTKSIRAKIDGTGFMLATSVAGSLSGYLQRTLIADNSQAAQFSEYNVAVGPAGYTGNAIQAFTKDLTVAKDITITGALANGADSIDWVYYLIEIMQVN